MRDLDSNSMICLQVIGFAGLTLITLNLVMFSYRAVIPDNPRSLARVGFIPVRGEREGRRTKNEGLKWHSHSFTVYIWHTALINIVQHILCGSNASQILPSSSSAALVHLM